MLKSILMVWVLVQNVPATQEAYEDYLGYQMADRGWSPLNSRRPLNGRDWQTAPMSRWYLSRAHRLGFVSLKEPIKGINPCAAWGGVPLSYW